MTRLVFLGPPGAGKGTQAKTLAAALHIPHLSTGDVLRAGARERSPLGVEAERFMNAGELVPDELVWGLVRERISRPGAEDGFLLDGFPRTIAQAEALESTAPVERAILFEIPEKVLVERLTQRWSCPKCGSVYNLATQPPKTPGHCDREGERLVQRPDDRPEAVQNRLAVYHRQTAPLVDFYRTKGTLVPVDASGTVDEVAARLRRAVGATPV